MKRIPWFENKNYLRLSGIAAVLISLLLFVVIPIYMVGFYTPVQPRQEYYSEDSNYLTDTGAISHLAWGPEKEYVFLSFDVIPDQYGDTTFAIRGENLRLVMERGFAEKVRMGTMVEYTSAPQIFWDGYSMPIVMLKVDGEVLLTFEEGKENLLRMIEQ